MTNSQTYVTHTAAMQQPRVEVDQSRQFIQISPAAGEPITASVIFMHGLGDTAMGWGGAMQMLAMSGKLPGMRFVLPTAPTQPVTMNGGYAMPSWYDIKGLDDRSNENCDGIEESRQTVLDLIERERADHGLDYGDIFVGGFSQGGALSLYTGLQAPFTLGGVLCLSGYLPNVGEFKLSAKAKAGEVPVCIRHGAADQVVRLEMNLASRQRLQETGLPDSVVAYKEYPELEHSATEEELDDVAAWLGDRLRK